MKRTLAALIAVGTVAALVIAVTAWAKPQGKPEHKGGKTITVIEHATTDATTDTGAPGRQRGRPADVRERRVRPKGQPQGRDGPGLLRPSGRGRLV